MYIHINVPLIISIYFASMDPDCLVIFRISSPGFLGVFHIFSLWLLFIFRDWVANITTMSWFGAVLQLVVLGNF